MKLTIPTIIFTLVAVACLPSCSSTSLTRANFIQASGPPLKQLGLKKIAPSEVVVRQIPDSAFASKEGMAKWCAAMDRSGLIPVGASIYNSRGRPGIEELRDAGANVRAPIVYTNVRFLSTNTETVSVPIMYTSGQTVTTSSNAYGSYGGGYGAGSYSGYGTSSTYIPGTTVYAPKQVQYNVFGVTNIFCAPPENLSPEGLQKMKAHQNITAR